MYPEYLKQYLPPGFEVAKYHRTSNMTIDLWIVNILTKLLGYKAYETQADLSSISEEDFEKLISALELLIDKALITELDERFSLMISDLIKMDKGKYTAQVRELNYYDLFVIADDLKATEMGQLYSEIGKSMIPPIAMLLQNKLGNLNNPVNYYDKYWENNSSSLLKLDLDSSDQELKSAFSDWLKEKRSKQKTQVVLRRSYQIKNLNEITFRKWHDARILAYMDLVTWNYAQGNKLTSKIIGDILFPEQRDLKDTTSVVNDTVKPLTAKLANIMTIKRMIKAFAESDRKKTT